MADGSAVPFLPWLSVFEVEKTMGGAHSAGLVLKTAPGIFEDVKVDAAVTRGTLFQSTAR